MRRASTPDRGLAALVLAVALLAVGCGGSGTPSGTGGAGATAAPASAGGSGGTSGGAITGKRVCEIVTLEMATQILGEAPPRGEASDDRLAKSHTCAYKPGPKLILQIQVIEGTATVDQFEALLVRLPEKKAADGIGEKAYFSARTEPPPGTRLYVLAKGLTILVNIGTETVPEESLQQTARDLVPTIINAL
jgi:hypothetical protein